MPKEVYNTNSKNYLDTIFKIKHDNLMAFGDENLQELLDEVFMSFPILENVKKPIDFSETEQSQIKNITMMGGLG